MINRILFFFETKAFGVCQWWGNKLGISVGNIRLFFIYASFLTVGSPIILYFIMVFILDHKQYFKFRKSKRKSVWDL